MPSPPKVKPTLEEIEDRLIPIFEPYTRKLLDKAQRERSFDLWGQRPVTIAGKQREEVYFAGLHRMKQYIGFYFMPIYTHPDHFDDLPLELRKCKKGKSCFYITTLDAELNQHIKDVLREGWKLYKDLGWI